MKNPRIKKKIILKIIKQYQIHKAILDQGMKNIY